METISKKQLLANRQNSKLGGVKTIEGKAVSKYNALKHGLLSKEVILADEDKNKLQELSEGLNEALKPQGELEAVLADRIVANLWRLKRCMKIEKSSMEYNKRDMRMDLGMGQEELGKIADMISGSRTDKILRYETTIERGIFKSLHELQRLQGIRKGGTINMPVAVDIDISNSKEN